MHGALLILSLIFVPYAALASSVVINEVLFDPMGTDTGLEWIEVLNVSDTPQDLSGWQLYPDGIGYFLFPSGFTIQPKGFAVVHLRAVGTNSLTDLYHSLPPSNMGNTSGSAALFSGEPRGKGTIKSFLQWGRPGETWETDAAEVGLWKKGELIDLPDFYEGSSIALVVDGNINGGKNAWHISVKPTSSATNMSGQESPPVPSPPTVSLNPSPQVPVLSPEPSISTYAGGDRGAMVGESVSFLGSARGLNGAILENARFWWNFGDGETREGRSVIHIFRVPGAYTVGLHVSSGGYAASDYLRVEVIPNKLEVSRVIVGGAGFLTFHNSSDLTTDIGGWILEDAKGKRFIVPPKTVIGEHSEIAFPHAVTGLLVDYSSLPLIITYPNGAVAFRKEGASEEETLASSPSAHTSPKAVSLAQSYKEEFKDLPLPVEEKNDPPAQEEKEVAAVSSSQSSLPLFFAALGIGLFAAIGFFIAKRWS